MNLLLNRRTLAKAMAALGALVTLDPAEAEEELQNHRRFWSLDERHVGLREFYHVYGHISADWNGNVSPIEMPPGKISEDTVVQFNKPGWADTGFEVEKILSSGKTLYRARIIPTIIQANYVPPVIHHNLDPVKNVFNAIQPVMPEAGPWLSPSEALTEHGIVIKHLV